jgi:hypothetical protein
LMASTDEQSSRMCVSCGRSIAMDANVCQHCGHDFRAPAGPAPKKKTVMPVIGGVLIMVGGILTLVSGLALMGTGGFLDDLVVYDVEGVDMLEDLLTTCGAILVIFGLIGLLGGVMGMLRKSFGLAIVGGIFALVGWFIPALVGLILIAISKEEFE